MGHSGAAAGDGRSSRAQWRLFAVACSLGCVALLDLVGAAPWTDAWLRRLHYRSVAPRESSRGVVLVAIDDATVARWGPPPYDEARLSALVSALEQAQPRALAVLEPASLVGTLPEATTALVDGRGGVALRPLALEHGEVAPLALADGTGAATIVGGVLARLGLHEGTRALGAAYLRGPPGLPVVSAHEVDEGLPPGTFDGRVVVVGITARGRSWLLPTPLGTLSPAEVEAHAILGALDGVAWEPIGPRVRVGLLAVVALALALALPRVGLRRALAILGWGCVVALAIDFVVLTAGGLLPGASAFLALLVLTAASTALLDRWAVARALGRVAAFASARVPVPVAADLARGATSAAALAGARSWAVLELAHAGGLVVRGSGGLAPDALDAWPLDARQEPWSSCLRALVPAWCDAPRLGGRTLLVPLVRDGRACGVWALTFEAPAGEDALVAVAGQCAGELARRLAPPPGTPAAALAAVESVSAAVAGLAGENARATALLDSLPFAIVSADACGAVRSSHGAWARASGVAPARGSGLVQWLVAISGLSAARCREALGEVVSRRRATRLEPAAHAGARELVLTPLLGEGGAAGRAFEGFLAIAGGPPRVVSSDAAELVFDAIRHLRALPCVVRQKPLRLRVESPAPLAPACRDAALEALVATLHDALSQGSSASSVDVVASVADGGVRVEIRDALPAAPVRLLESALATAGAGAHATCGVLALGAARDLVERAGGRLGVEHLEGGPALVVVLPAADGGAAAGRGGG